MKIPMLKKRYLLGFLFLITVVIGFILLWLRVSHYDDMGEPEKKRQAAIVLGSPLERRTQPCPKRATRPCLFTLSGGQSGMDYLLWRHWRRQ